MPRVIGKSIAWQLRLAKLCLAVFTCLFFIFDWTFGDEAPDHGLPTMISNRSTRLFLGLVLFAVTCTISARGGLDKEERRVRDTLILCSAVVVAAITFRLIFPTYRTVYLSLETYLFDFLALPVFFAGFRLGVNRRVAQRVLHTSAWICSILSALSYLSRITGPIGPIVPASEWNKSMFIFAFFWFFTRLITRPFNYRDLCGVLLASLEVLFAFKKHAYLNVFFALVVLILLLIVNRSVTSKKVGRLILMIGAIVGPFWLLLTYGPSNVAEEIIYRFYRVLSVKEGSAIQDNSLLETIANGRLDIWSDGYSRLTESPILGHGFGQTYKLHGLFNGHTGVTASFHNLYLDWAMSVGIFGTIPAVVCIYLWLRSVLRGIRLAPGQPVLVCMTAAAIGFMVESLGSVTRLISSTWLWWIFLAGITYGVSRSVLRGRRAMVHQNRPPELSPT